MQYEPLEIVFIVKFILHSRHTSSISTLEKRYDFVAMLTWFCVPVEYIIQ